MVTAPDLGLYTKDGWQIENEGIQLDVEIEQLPVEVIRPAYSVKIKK